MSILDSNTIIYLSKEIISIDDILEENQDISISVITYTEVLGYDFDSEKEEEFIRNFLNCFDIIYIDEIIVEIVIGLRKKYKIKLPDAIICASAILNKKTLITNDTRLKKIDELTLKTIDSIK